MAVVYRHIRLDKNEPFYIGIGIEESRASSKKNRNKYWYNIVNNTEYEVEILFNDLDINIAYEKEREFILLYGRIDLGTGTLVNMTSGGQGRVDYIMSDETKHKLRLSNIGKKQSKDSCDKKRKKALGNKYALGNRFKLSEEAINKISKNNSERFISEETKIKIGLSKMGKQPVIVCTHCGKEGGQSNMNRYHFNKCKNKDV